MEYDECASFFRREYDKSRHEYVVERERPVCEQRGAVQCSVCNLWFRSIGLSVHHYEKQLDTFSMDDSTTTIQLRRRPKPEMRVTAQRPSSQGALRAECGRRFS